MLALAALWASRVQVERDRAALRVGWRRLGAIGALLTIIMMLWGLLTPKPHFVQPPPLRPLRVMTYNIHQGLDADNRMNLQAIAAVIAAQNPDVLLLNEVNRARATNGFVDTLALISRRLDMPFIFGPNYADGQYGNALLSRYPILEWDNTHYSRDSTEIRGFMRVVVQAPGGPLSFYASHLDHVRDPGNARAEQLDELLAAWSGQPRAILLGDLNAEPDTPELQALYQAGLVDALAATGQDDAFTYWDPLPSRRIDYIFLTPDLSPRRAWVLQSRASDHLPVLVEVQMLP
jgi:endonuclease/exonuclease/phosphatase family metal-dependent hydrolase